MKPKQWFGWPFTVMIVQNFLCWRSTGRDVTESRTKIPQKTLLPAPCVIWVTIRDLFVYSLLTAHKTHQSEDRIIKHSPQHIIKMKIKYDSFGLVFKTLSNMALTLEYTIPFILHTS